MKSVLNKKLHYAQLKAAYAAGRTQAQIADDMNKIGIVTPQGKSMTQGTVCRYSIRWGLRQHNSHKRKYKVVAKGTRRTVQVVPLAGTQTLVDARAVLASNMSDALKLRTLTQLLG